MNFSIEEAREHEAMQRLRDHEAQEEQRQYLQRQRRHRYRESGIVFSCRECGGDFDDPRHTTTEDKHDG